MAREIDERIAAGWKHFGQYSSSLKDQKIPMCLKKEIMNTVILATIDDIRSRDLVTNQTFKE